MNERYARMLVIFSLSPTTHAMFSQVYKGEVYCHATEIMIPQGSHLYTHTHTHTRIVIGVNKRVKTCWIWVQVLGIIGQDTSNLPNITHLATKVHVMLRRYVILTWMHHNIDLV